MTLTFYKNTFDPRTVDKTGLSPASDMTTTAGGTGGVYTGYLKTATDMINPVFTVELDEADLGRFNYLYVTDWSRYYFVNSVKAVRTGLFEISCHVDVLCSFKTQIVAATAMVSRNQTNTRPYLEDPERIFSSDHDIIKVSPGSDYINNFRVDVDNLSSQVCNIAIMATEPNALVSARPTSIDIVKYPAAQYSGVGTSNGIYALDLANIGYLFGILNDNNFWNTFIHAFTGQDTQGIITILNFPFTIPSGMRGSYGKIKMYNSNVELTGHTDPQGYPLSQTAVGVFDFGNFAPTLAGDFTDFEPYTKCSVYLPYVGFTDIPMRYFKAGYVGIKYIVSFTTGECQAIISSNETKYIKTLSGQIGLKIPITGSNSIELARNHLLTGIGLMTAAPTLAMMDPLPAVQTIAGSISRSMTMPYTMQGEMSSSYLSRCMTHYPYLILEKAKSLTPASYGQYVGYPVENILSLSSVHGFTKIRQIFTNSFGAILSEEEQELKRLLSAGVILP